MAKAAQKQVYGQVDTEPKEPPSPDVTIVGTSNVAPTQEAIARLAYSYWEARGCQGGSPEDDWFTAEETLRTAG